ncbi:S1/P1 nuclease [Sphingomonas glaciei]|uniref:S1/P1 nuclease n=1 Tax=Sphingomonas glaciei TaxID=2938948 RepID=A0ABY5MSR6_9SPHN|nr:S1/P1 nuclease [Sphingomonas glaciei]UUR07193.1 S1/P1 nuclease [Sphingomonas glaciei]
MPIIRLLAALLALTAAAPAAAYWEYTHRLVASIAWAEVQPETRVRLKALMREGGRLETPECPVGTLEDASVWADCIKPLGDRFSYQSSWHYQNVNVCKPFSLRDACKDGNCVSAQIERNARLLADRKLPVRERVMALAYLTHFVGDLAQPMHGGDRGDLGGNQVPVTYGIVGGRTNLHGIWDGWIPERAVTSPPGGVKGLLGGVTPAQKVELAGGTVEDWSRKAWENAKTYAYTTALGDPCRERAKDERGEVTEAEVQALIPAVRQQVLAGGLRLARMLDDAVLRGVAPQPPRRGGD